MSYELKDRELESERVMYKTPTIPQEVMEYEQPVNLDELLEMCIRDRSNAMSGTVVEVKTAFPCRDSCQNIKVVSCSTCLLYTSSGSYEDAGCINRILYRIQQGEQEVRIIQKNIKKNIKKK